MAAACQQVCSPSEKSNCSNGLSKGETFNYFCGMQQTKDPRHQSARENEGFAHAASGLKTANSDWNRVSFEARVKTKEKKG